MPLFSLYSKKSAGVGEIPDLTLLVDWCARTGLSIIQLLPMNDTGFKYTPYDAQSSLALEPLYLSLDALEGVPSARFKKRVEAIRKEFPVGTGRVDYRVKHVKLELLKEMFQTAKFPEEFESFIADQALWLKPYALFKVIKEDRNEEAWESWPSALKNAEPSALKTLEAREDRRVRFHYWLQWQLWRQFTRVKAAAAAKKIFLMGDLPFLVSRDSADVWSQQGFFKLDRLAGAPPDLYFAEGQRWGMPAYDWERIAEKNFDPLREKLRYAEQFYDLFRIDHFVGLFRLWTVDVSARDGISGSFDPPDESRWETHGRRILSAMASFTGMLPCAEDLGTVPPCSARVLDEWALPGTDVQRWTKDWDRHIFKRPEEYRKNSVVTVSTHDMAPFRAWWETIAGTVDETLFRKKCEARGVSFDAARERLFDMDSSAEGRLRWRRGVAETDIEVFFSRDARDLKDILNLYHDSVDEKERFWRWAGLKGTVQEKATEKLVRAALAMAHDAASIFSVQLLADWLSLGPFYGEHPLSAQINYPGTVSDLNWSARAPVSLERLLDLKLNAEIRTLNASSGRLAD